MLCSKTCISDLFRFYFTLCHYIVVELNRSSEYVSDNGTTLDYRACLIICEKIKFERFGFLEHISPTLGMPVAIPY